MKHLLYRSRTYPSLLFSLLMLCFTVGQRNVSADTSVEALPSSLSFAFTNEAGDYAGLTGSLASVLLKQNKNGSLSEISLPFAPFLDSPTDMKGKSILSLHGKIYDIETETYRQIEGSVGGAYGILDDGSIIGQLSRDGQGQFSYETDVALWNADGELELVLPRDVDGDGIEELDRTHYPFATKLRNGSVFIAANANRPVVTGDVTESRSRLLLHYGETGETQVHLPEIDGEQVAEIEVSGVDAAFGGLVIGRYRREFGQAAHAYLLAPRANNGQGKYFSLADSDWESSRADHVFVNGRTVTVFGTVDSPQAGTSPQDRAGHAAIWVLDFQNGRTSVQTRFLLGDILGELNPLNHLLDVDQVLVGAESLTLMVGGVLGIVEDTPEEQGYLFGKRMIKVILGR